jgi:hypothetical protein
MPGELTHARAHKAADAAVLIEQSGCESCVPSSCATGSEDDR